MVGQQREFEIKFELNASDWRTLSRTPALQSSGGSPAKKKLRSIYFDTASRVLMAEGISLRLREKDGKWIQTVKFGSESRIGVSDRSEIEDEVACDQINITRISDDAIRERIEALCAGEILEPVFETIIDRETYRLTSIGGAKIELAIDSGEVAAAGQTRPLQEAEIEIKTGDPEDAYHWASLIFGDLPFQPSRLTKAEHGYSLLAGEHPPQRQPRKKIKFTLQADEPAENAFRTTLQACTEQIAENAAVIFEHDDPEGPHQFRVGLRRLRSALKAFKFAIRGEMHEKRTIQARDLGRIVGRLRDIDVMGEDIVGAVDNGHVEPHELDLLRILLRKNQEQTRQQVLGELRHARVTGFIYELMRDIEAAGWRAGGKKKTERLEQPVSALARDALDKCWGKVHGYGARIDALSVPERHEMRKRLKDLRYMTENFGGIFPEEKVQPYLKTLKQLQDVFGYLNDVAMAELLPSIIRQMGRGDTERALPLAAVKIVEWHQIHAEEAWRHSGERWQALLAMPFFWRDDEAEQISVDDERVLEDAGTSGRGVIW